MIIGAVLLLVGLAGCGRVARMVDPVEGAPTTQLPEVPPQFRAGGGTRGDMVARVTVEDVADVSTDRVAAIQDRERDLVWTDPDNPEAELQGMEELMAQSSRQRGPWMVSFSQAQKTAMREGKPLVVWFTDTRRSPVCKALSAEVFSRAEFGSWAEENVIRARLDFNVKGESRGPNDSAMDDRVRKLNYLESLKKRYKVLGLPTVLLLAPDGTVMGRYRGYERSYGDFYLQRLRDDSRTAAKHHEDWKRTMERRGYRDWTDLQGRTVFAKLLKYSAGALILVEPDGYKLRASEGNLSAVDRAWIAEEKAKRER